MASYWGYLIAAITFEVGGTLSLKLSEGFAKPMFAAVTVVGYLVAFGFLGLTLKGMPVSTAYAIWAGAGTALVALIGMAFLGEPAGWLKFASIALIIVGVVGLHMADRVG